MYKNIVTQPLQDGHLKIRDVLVDVLRLDLFHKDVSGNKWFKLKYHLLEAERNENEGILSFGGPYSNHLVALAHAGKEKGLNPVGIIRGEAPPVLNPSLREMRSLGMDLHFFAREKFQDRDAMIRKMKVQYPNHYIVPEGGQSEQGIKGATEILATAGDKEYTHIVCAVGTGTTMAGLVNGSHASQEIIGISALKVDNSLNNTLFDFLKTYCSNSNYSINFNYHFGGYAKKTAELLAFMNKLFHEENIPTDFVYTGKLFFGFFDLINNGFFPPGARVLIVHSGGLQGNRSLPPGSLDFDY